MKIAPAWKWRAPAIIAVLAAALIASAYLFWWKPLALTALRIALDRQLGPAYLRAGFEKIELSGLNTLVIHNLSFRNLDETTSLLIRQLRLTFSLRDLIRGRFQAPAALRHIVFDRPQLALTLPNQASATGMREAQPGGILPAPIPGVSTRIRDGRILVRDALPPTRMLTFSKIDGHILAEEDKTSVMAAFQTPDSKGQNMTLRARYGLGLLDVSASLKDVNIAPLAPWIGLLNPTCRPENGRLEGQLNLAFSRSSEGARMILQSVTGTLDIDGGGLKITGLPFKLEDINGRVRASGEDFAISGCSIRARETDWRVEGGISGFSSPRFSIRAQASSLEMSRWYSKLRGTAACRLVLESGANPVTLRVSGEARRASFHGVPCESVSADFTLSRGFSTMNLHESKATIGSGELEATGLLDLRSGKGRLKWTISPAGFPLLLMGEITADGQTADIRAATDDGFWKIEGKLANQDGALKAVIGGKAGAKGLLDFDAAIQTEPPHRIDGVFSLHGVAYRHLYLTLPKTLADFDVFLSASGKLAGEIASPKVTADLAASLSKPESYAAEFKGKIAASRTPEGILCAFDQLSMRAHNVIVDGDGSLARGKDGASGTGKFMISHLAIGRTSVESKAALTCSAKGGERKIDLLLTALRLNDQAYPDFAISGERDSSGSLSIKLLWEELFSAVIGLQDGRDVSVGVTAAFANLPVGPLAGFISLPAPMQKASGSLTIKGPLRHAGLKSSLSWPHGDCTAKGWIALDDSGGFALTLTALEQRLSAWVPLFRTVPALAGLPELESAVETRGLDLEHDGKSLSARGWLSARNLKIGDLLLGSGNLRIDKTAERAEMEASLSGESGTYVLYPSELAVNGSQRSLRAEFSCKNVPVGRGSLNCDQGGLRVNWGPSGGEGVFFLSGFALDESRAGEISVDLARDDDAWRLTPTDGSAIKTTGRLSFRQSRIKIEPDSRTNGAWLIIDGPGNTGAKLSGTWRFPASPESMIFAGQGLPAPAILPILGVPAMDGRADANLEWLAGKNPPLSGRIRLTQGRWGEFPFDIFEIAGTGTPGRAFDFSNMILKRGEDLRATGSGALKIHPERSIDLALTVDRLLLGYLKPFGFVEESSVIARGQLRISGNPHDPSVNGTLRCDVGSFSPPLGFARLYLKEGQVMFQGHRAIIDAGLTDLAGAAVVVSGGSAFKGLVPTDFGLAMTAPSPVRIDGLPDLFDGSARGKLNFEGTLKEPVLSGKVTLEDGRLRTPPRRKHRDPESLADRLSWDLKIRFGRKVRYALDPLGGTAVDLATISPSPLSLIEVIGHGEDVKIYGEVHADSGPLTLFLGRRIWKKRPDK